MKTPSRFLALALVFLAGLSADASACAVCLGDPNSKLAAASNGMMFFLLGILAFVFSLMGLFGYMMFRQAKSPTPPHVELGPYAGVGTRPE